MTEINHVIPQVAEAPSFGSPQADIFNRLLQERIVGLAGTLILSASVGVANFISRTLYDYANGVPLFGAANVTLF